MGEGFRDKARKIYKDVPIEEASLNTFIGLIELQSDISKSFSAKFANLDRERIREALGAGRPAVEVVDLQLSEEELGTALTRISGYLKEELSDARDSLTRIEEAQRSGQLSVLELGQAFLQGDVGKARAAAWKLEVDQEMLEALVAWVMQSVFQALSESVAEQVGFEGWSSGRCPVCGAFTRVEIEEPAGGTLLHCQFCGAEWRYSPARCPFCGNEDESSLRVFALEEDERFGVGVCRQCRNYWKIIYEGKAGADVPRRLYDIWTIKLDLLVSGR
ncbi:MAG: formate dehydrogenase accessory protein FdhE [Thermofilum sp.]